MSIALQALAKEKGMHTVRNISDDSIIEFACTKEEAKRIQKEVRNGDHDGTPRDCYVQEEEEET